MIERTEELVALVLLLTIGLSGLGAVLGLELLFFGAAIVGFVVVLPLIGVFGDRLFEDDDVDPLAALREQHARGELSDEEFERQVEQLAETGDRDRRENASEPPVPELDAEKDDPHER